MNVVFADSYYWFALLNRKDSSHSKAVDFTRGFDGRILTTEWVVTELADGWSKTATRPFFHTTLEFIESEQKIECNEGSRELWRSGIDLYEQRPDKNWSLTDCISFVVMERAGVSEALTGDHHFEQAGFVALLK